MTKLLWSRFLDCKLLRLTTMRDSKVWQANWNLWPAQAWPGPARPSLAQLERVIIIICMPFCAAETLQKLSNEYLWQLKLAIAKFGSMSCHHCHWFSHSFHLFCYYRASLTCWTSRVEPLQAKQQQWPSFWSRPFISQLYLIIKWRQ